MEFVTAQAEAKEHPERREIPLPKGVAPERLVAQVRNTAPFLFTAEGPAFAPWTRIGLGPRPETHAQYFDLCLAAHHATVATFVPTDVDVAIRFKLWTFSVDVAERRQMAERVLESYAWDSTPISARWLRDPENGEILTGHHGEWFSTSAAAYGSLRHADGDLASEIAARILREVQREADFYARTVKRRDAIGALKASTLVAHNLGDLTRVFEAWNLEHIDPLREAVERQLAGESLTKSGELNKKFMAVENHRHYALRAAKGLRRHVGLLLPLGPFCDEWGEKVASVAAAGGITAPELGETIEALVDGHQILAGVRGTLRTPAPSVGYARALAGIESRYPGGLQALCDLLPSRIAKEWKTGDLRQKCTTPRERFDAQWATAAAKFLGI